MATHVDQASVVVVQFLAFARAIYYSQFPLFIVPHDNGKKRTKYLYFVDRHTLGRRKRIWKDVKLYSCLLPKLYQLNERLAFSLKGMEDNADDYRVRKVFLRITRKTEIIREK